MQKFNWEYIHDTCDLNKVTNNLWSFSRFYGLRFTYIINMIEEEFYYEALLNLLLLLEQILSAKLGKDNSTFKKLIAEAFKDEKKEMADLLKTLRNRMVHKYPFKYYVKFDTIDEYPLDELSNYEHILFKLFLPIISCIDEKYNVSLKFIIGEYSLTELARQYGFKESDLNKVLEAGIDEKTPKGDIEKIKKENEFRFMRLLNNSSPVPMLEEIFKELL